MCQVIYGNCCCPNALAHLLPDTVGPRGVYCCRYKEETTASGGSSSCSKLWPQNGHQRAGTPWSLVKDMRILLLPRTGVACLRPWIYLSMPLTHTAPFEPYDSRYLVRERDFQRRLLAVPCCVCWVRSTSFLPHPASSCGRLPQLMILILRMVQGCAGRRG